LVWNKTEKFTIYIFHN